MLVSLSLLSCFLLTSSPLHYALLLVGFSSLVIYNMVMYSVISGLMGFLILLVYLGAMMILLAYVCAVTPNLYQGGETSLNKVVLFILAVLLFLFMNLVTFNPVLDHSLVLNLPVFFYTSHGVLIFYFIMLMMLVVLFITSTSTQVSTPMRSSN